MTIKLADLQKLSLVSNPTSSKGLALDLAGRVPNTVPVTSLRVLTADPINPLVGEFWYRSDQKKLCIQHDASTIVRVALA